MYIPWDAGLKSVAKTTWQYSFSAASISESVEGEIVILGQNSTSNWPVKKLSLMMPLGSQGQVSLQFCCELEFNESSFLKMGRFIEAGKLFGVAKYAAHSITAPPREGNQHLALTSIVFSVLAAEAFFNEMTEIAAQSPHLASEPDCVVAFVQFMNDSELARISLLGRILHCYWILSGRNVKKGQSPFQDFATLVGLRNDLVHFKPNENIPYETGLIPEEVHEKRLKRLKSKQILADFPRVKYPWTYYVETKAVAEWSCATASDLVLDFCKIVPTTGVWGTGVKRFGENLFTMKPLR